MDEEESDCDELEDIGTEKVYLSDPCSADEKSYDSEGENSGIEREGLFRREVEEEASNSFSSSGDEAAEEQVNSSDEGVSENVGRKRATESVNKGKRKKKKRTRRSSAGAPMSLKTATGEIVYPVIDYSKKKMTEAEKRNLVEVKGIRNVPDGFGWTDLPRFSKEPAVVLPCSTQS